MPFNREKRLDENGNIVYISSAKAIFVEPYKTLPPGFKTLHQYRKWERGEIKRIEAEQKAAKKQAKTDRKTPPAPPSPTTGLPTPPEPTGDIRKPWKQGSR